MLDAEVGDGVVDGQAADDQRGAAGDAADRHDEARLEAEDVARGHFAEEADAIPDRPNPFQQNARAGARRFRTHQRGGRLPHFLHTRVDGGGEHADHEQRDAERAVQPVVFQPQTGHHIHALQYDQQERRNAKEAGDQAEAAADEAGEQREQQVARRDRQPPVAEPHVRADERAVLFDHARHGGQAHHHGHQQEHNRERVAERLDGVEVGFERAEPAERLPVLHIPAHLRNAGFQLVFLGFQRLFGTCLLLVQLRLRLVELLLGLRQFGTSGDDGFTHCFTRGFVKLGGSCTCGRRRTCVRAVCRSSRSCRARLHADDLVDLLVELLPIRVDLRLRVRELLVGFRTRVGDLLVARVEQFLPTGLLAVGFHGAVDAVGHLLDGVFVRFVERAFGGRALDEQRGGRVEGAGHAIGRREERVVGGGGGTERGHGGVAVRVAQVLRIEHHAHDGELGREARRLVRAVRFIRAVRTVRIGSIGSIGGSRFGGYGEAAADTLARIANKFPGYRDFAGFLRHAPFLQVWLVNAVRADFLHGRRLAAVQIERHFLRPFRLHFRNTVHLAQRGDIAVRQARGGQHLDVVQALRVEKAVGAAERVTAARVNAGEHGHTEQRDHGDGNESFPRMRPHSQHVLDECHVDLRS